MTTLFLRMTLFTPMELKKQLREAIDAKVRGTSCVVILAGVYSSYSKWINEEIEIAKSYGKPIIAVEPWASERTSSVVKNNANRIVKWARSLYCVCY